MKCDLTGKVALVTGGAGGFGREIVQEFLLHGANVAITDLDLEAAKALKQELDLGGERTIAQRLEVSNSENVHQVFDEAMERFGTLDILVNCAGITKRMEPLNYPEAVFDKIIAVNLKGSFLCAQAAARVMAKKGYGKIINFASVGGVMGLPNTVAYCASKGGIVNMTRALAIDLAQYQISVNCIAPCSAQTKISESVYSNPEEYNWFMSRIPMGRKCQPSDVAYATLFLAAPESDFITGHTLPVDGGWLCI